MLLEKPSGTMEGETPTGAAGEGLCRLGPSCSARHRGAEPGLEKQGWKSG